MLKHLTTKSCVALSFTILAGCGGGGGGDSNGVASAGGNQSPTTESGNTTQTTQATETTQTPQTTSTTQTTQTTQTTLTTQPTSTTQPNQPSLAAAVAVADGVTLGNPQWPDGSTPAGGQGQDIGGMTCSTDPATYTYTQLILLQDGQQLALPADIGIGTPSLSNPATCVYPVHTRDRTGKIRVNASAGVPHTLGQLFAVWGRPLSATNVAGIEGATTIYLNDNGTLSRFDGDPATIELLPQRQIVVMLGAPVTQIPNYAWQALPPLAATPWILEGGERGTLGVTTWPDGSNANGGTGAPLGNLACNSNLTANLDLNTYLAIYRNGQQLAIPQDIGRTATCEYEVHTHNRSGAIHTASTEYKRFTLGDFFAIWGQPLSLTNVAGFTGEPIEIYIEDKGDLRRFTGDPATIDLASHRSIVIQIGTPLAEIPTYDWLNFGPF